MKKSTKYDVKVITDKVWQGIELTVEEEKFYLLEIMGQTPQMADTIIAQYQNKNPYLIID